MGMTRGDRITVRSFTGNPMQRRFWSASVTYVRVVIEADYLEYERTGIEPATVAFLVGDVIEKGEK